MCSKNKNLVDVYPSCHPFLARVGESKEIREVLRLHGIFYGQAYIYISCFWHSKR
jgi:hypothetical protein